MSLDFEKNYILALVFNSDLTKIILRTNNLNFLDGFFFECNDKSASNFIDLTKYIKEKSDLELDVSKWRSIFNLQQIERKIKIDVVINQYDTEFKNIDNICTYELNNLPINLNPKLRWIIPMTLDMTIIGSEYNQIIIR